VNVVRCAIAGDVPIVDTTTNFLQEIVDFI